MSTNDTFTTFFSPSIGNPYLCQVCTDGETHCSAHVVEGIALGQTRDPVLQNMNQPVNDIDNPDGVGASLVLDEESEQLSALDKSLVGTMIGRSSFRVTGICCSAEVPGIRKVVHSLPGIMKVRVNIMARTVYVDHKLQIISAVAIAEALNQERFGASIMKDAANASDNQRIIIQQSNDSRKDSNTKNYRSAHLLLEYFKPRNVYNYIVGRTVILADSKDNSKIPLQYTLHPFVILSGIFWFVALFSLLPGWDRFATFSVPCIIFGLPPILTKSVYSIRRGMLDSNCNMLFATIGAMFLGEYIEAAAVTFLFAISEWLENIATSRARVALNEIVNLKPDRATIIDPVTKQTISVPASSVGVGDLISVKTGDKIACDGVVVKGSSIVDESSLTGEPRPVKKFTNDAVSGGTINVGASPLLVKATSAVEDSAIARLIQLVEEAQSSRSNTERLIDSLALKVTPIIVTIGVAMCTIPWIWGPFVGRKWMYLGINIVVIACPCGLVISTPVTYIAGLAATAKKGIIVKGGTHLEALGRVNKVIFDKTGTITKGKYALVNFGVIGNKMSYTEIMELLAVMEGPSSHPLATALVNAAKSEGIEVRPGLEAADHTLLEGEGVTAKVKGDNVYVGNKKLFKRLGYLKGLPLSARNTANEWTNSGGTVGYIGIDGTGIVGIYCVMDSVREEAPYCIEALKVMGIKSYLFTGDDQTAAAAVSRHVGIPAVNVKSQLLPEDKMKLVNSFKETDDVTKSTLLRRGRDLVLMVGDGVNDAPALAAANVSVSMGSGAAVAMETSNVTLLDSSLQKLVYVIEMGERVNRTIVENIVFSVVAKIVIILVTVLGSASLWGAIISDVGTMLVVTINGMKLLPHKDETVDLIDMAYDVDGKSLVELPITKGHGV